MKFLSLWRPWDWAIFDDVARKHIENRKWPPPIRMIGETIALQSVPRWDDNAIRWFIKIGLTHFPNRIELYPHDIIRGVVTIDRVVTEARTLPPDQQRWFMGPFAWVLTDVKRFETPVPCKGGQGLRNLPTDVDREVRWQELNSP